MTHDDLIKSINRRVKRRHKARERAERVRKYVAKGADVAVALVRVGDALVDLWNECRDSTFDTRR